MTRMSAHSGRPPARQVNGIVVDFARALEVHVDDTAPLLDISLRLAETPCSPLYRTHVSPDRATVAMFGARLIRLATE